MKTMATVIEKRDKVCDYCGSKTHTCHSCHYADTGVCRSHGGKG